MSSELVLYILSAARRPVSTVCLTYDCTAGVYEVCALITVRFLDGHETMGKGCTIFGALHDLMVSSRGDAAYWQKWAELH